MCHRNSGKAYERVLREEDLAVVEHHYPTISPAILRGVYECITDQNYPQPGVLIAVADLLYRDQQNLTGKYGIPVLPFSAMDLDNGERIQSRPMAAFHAVFESFSLAERNFRLLKEYLYEKLGVEIVLFCDCGCGLIPESEKENETVRQMLNSMNAFRSYFESIGTAVILTDSFDTEERKKRTLDMSSVEIDAYTRMYAILSSLERYPSQTPADILMIMNGLKKLQSQEAQLLTVV